MKLRLVYFLNDSVFDDGYICDSPGRVLELIEGDKDCWDTSKREQNRITRNLEAIKEWLESPRKHGDKITKSRYSVVAFECPELAIDPLKEWTA
jgi:hypothetical protein